MIDEVKEKLARVKADNLKWLWRYTAPLTPALIGVTMIGVVTSLVSVALALLTKAIIDIAVAADSFSAVLLPAGAYIFLTLLNILFQVLSSMLRTNTTEKLSMSIRLRLFEKITNAEWTDVKNYHSGDLLTRVTSDISVVTNSVMSIFGDVLTLIAQFAFSFVVLLQFDRFLAVVIVCLAPVTGVLLRLISRILTRLYKDLQQSESKFREFIQEAVANIVVVKAFQSEKRNMERLRSLHYERMRLVYKKNRISMLSASVLSVGYMGGYVFSFIWGIRGIVTKTITYGTLSAYLQLVSRVQAPIIGLAQSLPQVLAMFASVERLREIDVLKTEEEGAVPDHLETVGLSLKHVHFAYNDEKDDGDREVVLADVTLDVAAGEIVAVTGFSGAGKTTLIRLLLALLHPDSGEVLFYDQSARQYPAGKATRAFLSYIPQGNTLISGSVYENVTFGVTDCSDEAVRLALATACASDFIDKLPDKWATRLGEKGVGLSEGQAQRLAIARALLRKRPLLILDEATSALDKKTEIDLFNNIRKLPGAPACLVITHREYALDISSKVYNLEDGTLHKVK